MQNGELKARSSFLHFHHRPPWFEFETMLCYASPHSFPPYPFVSPTLCRHFASLRITRPGLIYRSPVQISNPLCTPSKFLITDTASLPAACPFHATWFVNQRYHDNRDMNSINVAILTSPTFIIKCTHLVPQRKRMQEDNANAGWFQPCL